MTPASPPANLAEAQQRILSETPLSTRRKHTQPTLYHMVEHQKGLRDRRERERRRIFQNKQYSKEDEQRDNAAPTSFYGPQQAIASVKHRLYPNFAMTRRVLLEAGSLVPRFRPRRILDFGSGCGSAAAASWDLFGSSIEWIHLIDASKTMREVSETLLKGLVTFQEGNEGETDSPVDLSLPRITASAHMSLDSDSAFDLCLASFTLTELPESNSILAATALMYEKLRPGGLLVILEPGTPDGFATIRMVRNMLLDCCPAGSEDACEIVAPCTHSGKCPMERNYGNRRERRAARRDTPNGDVGDSESLEDDDEKEEGENAYGGTRVGFCSFVQTMSGGTTRRRGEKLSYLVVRKRAQHSEEKDPDGWDEIDLPDHLQRRLRVNPEQPMHPHLQKEAEELRMKYLQSEMDDLGLEFLRGSSHRRNFGRILQAPNKKKGHVMIDCCVDGRIERHKIPKSLNTVAPGLYGAARKSRWGGYWLPTKSTLARDT